MRICFLFLSLILISCSFQPDKTDGTSGVNKFADPTQQRIFEWQDRRLTDSLITILKMSEPEYQKSAALALASVQDEKAIHALSEYLSHQNAEVRQTVGYALGQTFDSMAYEPLKNQIDLELDESVKSTLLEAAGKTLPESKLEEYIQYAPKSANATEGFMWGLYRAGLRKIYNHNGTTLAVEVLDTATTDNAKLAAAHYLTRVGFEDLPYTSYEVINKGYKNPEVRMAVASIISKAPALVASNTLERFLKDDDYRVRINAIRAIPDKRILNFSKYFDTLLVDRNVNTAIAMSSKIAGNAERIEIDKIQEWLQKPLNWRVKAQLLGAILKKEPNHEKALEQVKVEFAASKNVYEKAALLDALSYSFTSYEFIVTETFRAKNPAIATAGITTLSNMRQQEDFPEALKNAFRDIFIQAIETGDPALIDISAAVLRDPDLNIKGEIENFSFLKRAKEKLKLPRQNETLQSLEKTLAYFEGREEVEVVNTYNNPIDWEVLKNINTRHYATIQTTKGDIRIFLYTNEAPGTVANFIKLAKNGYFNNKAFHRVVPNFVVQGGGNRGDGYGGEDYSIRSEFPLLKYKTGTLGMASAGKDTEGTQWFITHSPTPHLDGRYTIFAQVESGLDVLHKIEQGDIIKSVKIN